MFERILIAAIVVLAAAVGVTQVSKLGQHEPTVMDQIQGGVYSQSAVDFAAAGLNAELAEGSLTDPSSPGLAYLRYIIKGRIERPDLVSEEEVRTFIGQANAALDATMAQELTDEQYKLLDQIKEASNEASLSETR